MMNTMTSTQYDGITYVIPCSAGKLGRPAPARDLYTGPMFRHTLAAAQASAAAGTRPARILILSALHGLVGLDTVLAPYDCKIGQPGSVTPAVLAAQALALGIDWGSDVDALLPAAYFAVLNEALRTLDVYAREVYEAAPGIGYQRNVNACVRQAA
jgi:hypothetical protein